MSTDELPVLAVDAKVRRTKARRPWSVCTGPASAFIATIAESGWTIVDAIGGCNDIDEEAGFVKGPPIVINQRVGEAVEMEQGRSSATERQPW